MSTRFNPFRREINSLSASGGEGRGEVADSIPETTCATSAALLAPDDPCSTLNLFIAAYGQAAAPKIPLPYGMMAVTLCAKFNDSAPQVDHFNYHAGLGCPDFALLIVPKQAKTEKLARRALALCPDLAVGIGPCGTHLEWTWKSETWSLGHGNYLQSSNFELPPELRGCATFTFGRNTPLTHAFWEIEFTTNLREGQSVELYPHRNFRPFASPSPGGEGLPRGVGLGTPPGRGEGGRISASIILNPSKNGVEIHFSRRPDDAALQPLRDDRRWRYTGFSRCWYSRACPETIAWAHDFVSRFNPVAADVSPRPLSPPLNGDTTPVPTGSRAAERDVVSPATL